MKLGSITPYLISTWIHLASVIFSGTSSLVTKSDRLTIGSFELNTQHVHSRKTILKMMLTFIQQHVRLF